MGWHFGCTLRIDEGRGCYRAKTIGVTLQIIAYIIFQLAGSPGLGGAGGGVRRVGDCGEETVPTLLAPTTRRGNRQKLLFYFNFSQIIIFYTAHIKILPIFNIWFYHSY